MKKNIFTVLWCFLLFFTLTSCRLFKEDTCMTPYGQGRCLKTRERMREVALCFQVVGAVWPKEDGGKVLDISEGVFRERGDLSKECRDHITDHQYNRETDEWPENEVKDWPKWVEFTLEVASGKRDVVFTDQELNFIKQNNLDLERFYFAEEVMRQSFKEYLRDKGIAYFDVKDKAQQMLKDRYDK